MRSIAWLPENLTVNDNNGVRANDDRVRLSRRDHLGFRTRQTLGVCGRRFIVVHRFVDVGWSDRVCHSDEIEQLATAR